MTEDGKKALMTLSDGDMRRVINVLQSTHMSFGNVTEDTVYTCVGHPLKSDIENILNWLLNTDSFQEIYKSKTHVRQKNGYLVTFVLIFLLEIQELKTNKGLALENILKELHLFVMRGKVA